MTNILPFVSKITPPETGPQLVLSEFLLGGGFGQTDRLKKAHLGFLHLAKTQRPIEEWTSPGDAIAIWALVCLELDEHPPVELFTLIEANGEHRHWLGQLAYYLLHCVLQGTILIGPLRKIVYKAEEHWNASNAGSFFFQEGRLNLDYRSLLIGGDTACPKPPSTDLRELPRTVELLEEIAATGDWDAEFILALTGNNTVERLVRAADGGYANAALHLGFCEFAEQPALAALHLRQATMAIVRENFPGDDPNAFLIEEAQYRLQEIEFERARTITWGSFDDALNAEANALLQGYSWSNWTFGGQEVNKQCLAVLRCRSKVVKTVDPPEENLRGLVQEAARLAEVVCKWLLRTWYVEGRWIPNKLDALEEPNKFTNRAWWAEQSLLVPGLNDEAIDRLCGHRWVDVEGMLRRRGHMLMESAATLKVLACAVVLSTQRWERHPFRQIPAPDLRLPDLFNVYDRRNKSNVAHHSTTSLNKEESLQLCDFVLEWTNMVMTASRASLE